MGPYRRPTIGVYTVLYRFRRYTRPRIYIFYNFAPSFSRLYIREQHVRTYKNDGGRISSVTDTYGSKLNQRRGLTRVPGNARIIERSLRNSTRRSKSTIRVRRANAEMANVTGLSVTTSKGSASRRSQIGRIDRDRFREIFRFIRAALNVRNCYLRR